eukprot:COSAG06_NODE_1023_length_11042_cov_2.398337_1_plen_2013_part_00
MDADYAAALARIKAASRAVATTSEAAQQGAGEAESAALSGAQAELQEARAELKRIKKKTTKARKQGQAQTIEGLGTRSYWEKQPPNPAWQCYPPPRELPRDRLDPRWTESFDPVSQRSEASAFWDEWGFVVFRDVLSASECAATVAEIWSTLEERTPGLSRAEPASFDLLPAKRYGLPDEQAVFTPQIVRNRQSPRLYAALDVVTPAWPDSEPRAASVPSEQEPGPNSIRVSHDRWCLYPPALGADGESRPNRQTNNPGAHLDICPWEYLRRDDRRYDAETDIDRLEYDGPTRVRQLCDFRAEINNVRGDRGGPHNQGVLNLVDNEESDGGTAVVPGFHRCYSEWSKALGPWEQCRVGQRRRGNAFVFGNPFDPIHGLMRRVTMRAGSLVLWNQTLVHGAVPNASKNIRVAQFVRGFRAGELAPGRSERRARAVTRELKLAGVLGELGPLAPHVFGVSKLEPEPEPELAACGSPAVKLAASERAVGPVDGAAWEGSWPRQLSADEAGRLQFDELLDLLPDDDDGTLIAPVHPDIDRRTPMTYGQLRQLAKTLRDDPALATLRGRRVAVVLPNGPELAAAFLALSGAVQFAPLNPELSEDEVSFALKDLPAAALIVRAGKPGAAARVASKVGIQVYELQPSPTTCGDFCLVPQQEVADSAERATADTAPVESAVGRSRIALLVHTSGTTRRPKLVPLTHSQLGIGAICVASTLQLKRTSMAINVMPLFHLHGLMINVLVSAIAGASMICAPRFDAPLFFRWLLPIASADSEASCRAAPNWYSAVPTIHQEVLRYAELQRDKTGAHATHSLTLIRNCSAALAPSTGARLEAALPGATVITSYAMTEALPICSNPLRAPRDLSSVGPAAGPDVRVVDEYNVPVAQNQEGEVVVRGLCAFTGYEKREHLGFDPNEQAFHPGGWFRTGDKGRLDEKGHLHLTGRFKELINRAGEKISPLAVEHAILALAPKLLPGVLSLMTFAAPHEEFGEAVGVAVVCDKGVTVSLIEIRRCGTQSSLLGKKWLPQMLVHLSDLPKGPTGKPARIGLAEKLGLPTLSLKKSMHTVDLRGGQPLDYESGRRAEARKAAAKRSAARRGQPSSDTTAVAMQQGSTETMEGCVQLVTWAMAEASGEVVGETDDLFDAGLSSISVTRLRDEIEGKTGLTLPPNLIYDQTTVRALAAAIFCIQRSTQTGSGTVEIQSEESVPVLTLQATDCFRNGDLPGAEALSIRAIKAIGVPDEWWSATTKPPVLTQSTSSELAPLLSLMVSVWVRMQCVPEAHAACKLLLAARSQSAVPTRSIDMALAWAQLARLDLQLGDKQSAAKAAAIAVVDGELSPATSGLSAADVHELPDVMKCDANCVKLRLFDRVPGGRWCEQCLSLQTLVVRHQELTQLPACISELRNLRILDASDNVLEVLPSSIGSLGALCELILNCNRLSCLPACLADLPELHTISLQSNRFARIPCVVLRCVHLKTLRWGIQTVVPAPEPHGGMVAEDFEAKLEAISHAVAAIEDQIELDPDNMQLLKDLQHLHRQHSEVVAISTESPDTAKPMEEEASLETAGVFGSRELRVLEMEANRETSLAQIPTENTVLTAVLASFNQLGEVPAQLTAFGTSLKRLQLGSNSIAHVDDQVLRALSGLTCLMLEGNRLRELPASVGELLQLRELAIYGNQLQEFPSELGQCASLTKLDAHHNCLETLPLGMAKLAQLKSLYLQNNRLCGLTALRERVLRHLPLLNLGLGANCFDLAEAFEQPGTRVGLAWNHGEPPASLRGVLTDHFATVDHLYDPASKDERGEILLVAFAAQGPGMQQWASPTAAIRAAGLSIDTLYLADPSNSYYMRSPERQPQWEQGQSEPKLEGTTSIADGPTYYAALIEKHAKHYEKRVMIVGSSMGATAALLHARCAQRVLAFGPRVDLELTHGSFLAPYQRAACNDRVMDALKEMTHADVSVHVGAGNLEDVLQARLISGLRSVRVEHHDTFHHNVPMYLEREGLLVPLLKRELLALMLDQPPPLQ